MPLYRVTFSTAKFGHPCKLKLYVYALHIKSLMKKIKEAYTSQTIAPFEPIFEEIEQMEAIPINRESVPVTRQNPNLDINPEYAGSF